MTEKVDKNGIGKRPSFFYGFPVYIARHADAAYVDGEIALTKSGKRQAHDNANYLADYCDIRGLARPSVIITSPLKRAIETAEIYADVLGVDKNTIVVDDRLAERYGRGKDSTPTTLVGKEVSYCNENSTHDEFENRYDLGERFKSSVFDHYYHYNEGEGMEKPCESILFVSHLCAIEAGCMSIISKITTENETFFSDLVRQNNANTQRTIHDLYADNIKVDSLFSALAPMEDSHFAAIDRFRMGDKISWRLLCYNHGV